MQTRLHKALPINDIIESNDGKRIDMMTNMMTTTTRMMIFRMPRVQLVIPTRAELSEIARGSRPAKTSIVLTMGRAFKGSFVNGIMAIRMLMKTALPLGYPLVPIMFEVISSITSSPNMRIPATAVAASNIYVKVKVILTPLAYF